MSAPSDESPVYTATTEEANFLSARLSKMDNLEPRSMHAPTAERGAGGIFYWQNVPEGDLPQSHARRERGVISFRDITACKNLALGNKTQGAV